MVSPHPFEKSYYGANAEVFQGDITICGGFNSEKQFTNECYKLVKDKPDET